MLGKYIFFLLNKKSTKKYPILFAKRQHEPFPNTAQNPAHTRARESPHHQSTDAGKRSAQHTGLIEDAVTAYIYSIFLCQIWLRLKLRAFVVKIASDACILRLFYALQFIYQAHTKRSQKHVLPMFACSAQHLHWPWICNGTHTHTCTHWTGSMSTIIFPRSIFCSLSVSCCLCIVRATPPLAPCQFTIYSTLSAAIIYYM